MFTGIITHLGRLRKREKSVFVFSADISFIEKITKGTSVAVNGVCLTVFKKRARQFFVEIMPETAGKTMLGDLRTHNFVNLELPLRPADFLSGHLVLGHCDGKGMIKKITREGNSRILTVGLPGDLSKYVVEKGSIAVNGVSLTVIKCGSSDFTVGLIPYTWNQTSLKFLKVNESVNLEVDILAKYVEKMTSFKGQTLQGG